MGRLKDALDRLKQAVTTSKSVGGAKSRFFFAAMTNYSSVLKGLGRGREALQVLQENYPLIRGEFGPGHSTTLTV